MYIHLLYSIPGSGLVLDVFVRFWEIDCLTWKEMYSKYKENNGEKKIFLSSKNLLQMQRKQLNCIYL